jgi:acetyl-CoA C-acetyltransferase
MNDVVVCSPVGRYGSVLKSLTAAQLGSTVVSALLERTCLPLGAVDDVVLGQCYPNGVAPALSRVVALDAGLPTTTPGCQIDRRYGTGLQAVLWATMEAVTGGADGVLGGGGNVAADGVAVAGDVFGAEPAGEP